MKYKRDPWQHQLVAIAAARNRPDYALFFEMGAGKTLTTVNILRDKMRRHGGILKTLILCPQIVIENWKREWLDNSYLKPEDIICLTGPASKRAKTIRDHYDTAKIFVTNYEALIMTDVINALKFYGLEAIVADESHKIKDMKTKRTKACIDLADRCKFRYILTGSPILNSPMDAFSQFRFLDKGETFGSNFFIFRQRYFYDKNAYMPRDKHFPNWVPKPGALAEMNKLIANKSMRVKKEECLDLPPLVKKQIFVELSTEQRKAYEEMRKDFITYVEGKACVAQMALTKALRLMQIVSGFASVEGLTNGAPRVNVEFDATPRLAALRELLDEIVAQHKVIVWACWRENYTSIRKLLEDMDIQHAEVHGDFNHGQKQQAVDFFLNNPGCRVLLANPAACGTGVNLTAASYAIYYSRNFSLEQDLQSEARNHRGGSEIHDKITRIDLVAKGTIDELVTKKLYQKVAIGEAILGEISKGI